MERGGAEAEAERLRAALDLWRRSPNAYALVKSVLAIERPEAKNPERAADWGRVFDRAAEVSPEAGVALYSLGSPALLEAATAELIDHMRAWNLLGPERMALEIGCGIGRCVAKLAAEIRLAIGIDVSRQMLDLAAARCAGLARTAFVQTSGSDLSAFRDGSFDLVFAVDSFPYLVRTGMELAAAHIYEARRLLKRGGALLILNFSYRGDIALDRADVARFAANGGFELAQNGTREFRLWDGAAFLLRRQES
jgi:SAM-dependent methyltransferase